MKVEIQVEKTTSMGKTELEHFGGNADALICMLLLDKGDRMGIETYIRGIMSSEMVAAAIGRMIGWGMHEFVSQSWQRDAFHHAIERYAERAEIEFGDVET